MINKNKNKKENLSEDKEDIKNTEDTSLSRLQKRNSIDPFFSKTGKAGKTI